MLQNGKNTVPDGRAHERNQSRDQEPVPEEEDDQFGPSDVQNTGRQCRIGVRLLGHHQLLL